MIDSRCLDVESENEIAEIYYAVTNLGFENTFDAMITMINLFYDDYVTCNYAEALSVFLKSCEKSEEACRTDSILHNLEINVFEVLSVATSISDVVSNFSFMDKEEVQQIMLQLGKDSSKLVKIVFDVKQPKKKYGHNSSQERD